MKPIRTPYAVILFLIASLPFYSQAQTVTANNESWATLVPGGSCTNCTITIPAGWTLLLNSNGTCNGCTFNGGTVNITSGFTFNNNATNFNNDTVLFNTSTSGYTFNFNNDSVAVNAAVNSQNNTATVSNSRFAVNAALTFNAATISNDSIHLNNALKINNSPADFSGSHVSLSTNGTIATPASTFTNSVLAFAGNSNLNVSNAMTMDGSSFYMAGNSYAKAASITMQNNSNAVMTGSNSFQSSNALTLSGSTLTIASTSTVTAASITAASSTITASDNTKITSSNAITLTGTTVTMNNAAAFKGSSAAVQTGSTLTMNGSATITINNAFDITASNVTMNGTAAIGANTSNITSTSSLTMNGSTKLSLNNGLDVKASSVALNGNAAVSDNTTTIESNSNFVVGDGTTASTAHLSTTNSLQVLDNSLLKIVNGNNYFFSNSSSFTGGSSSYTIKPNTISCNTGATTTYANSCTSGYVYGCATLNNAGAVGCMTLALANLELIATLTGTDAVTLSWTDANNANENHFQVQRSTGSQDWSTIGTVTANGYSTGDYQLQDPAPAAGTNTYRIQVIDKEGHLSYSNISTVAISHMAQSIHIYPNPVTGHTFFVRTASTSPVLVNLFTLSGQLLSRTSLEGQTQYTLKLPASMTPGNYMVVQVIGTESTQAFNLLIR